MATTVLASIGDHGVLNAPLYPGLPPVWIDRDLSWLDFNERVLARQSLLVIEPYCPLHGKFRVTTAITKDTAGILLSSGYFMRSTEMASATIFCTSCLLVSSGRQINLLCFSRSFPVPSGSVPLPRLAPSVTPQM